MADVQTHLDSLALEGVLTEGQTSGRYADGLSWRFAVTALTAKPSSAIDDDDSAQSSVAGGGVYPYWIGLETVSSKGALLVKLQTAKLVKVTP